MKTFLYASIIVATGSLLLMGCDAGSLTETGAPEAISVSPKAAKTSASELFAYLPSGDVGGGPLEAGLFFPPTKGGKSTLLRTEDGIQYTIHTTGLPGGAYTVWVVFINDPDACLTSPCTEVDVFTRQGEIDSSVYWSTGGIVQANGVGNFTARLPKGYAPTTPEQIGLPGSGLQNPLGAEIHLIVKYHGPASDDPDVLYEQMHSLLGSCFEGANALDLGEPFPGLVFGIQCFDPQAAIHQAE
jgi:hypothetical protein